MQDKTPLAIVLCILFGIGMSAPAVATPDVHCTGDPSTHGQENPPQAEATSTGGQCHGTFGDSGDCNVNYEGNSIGTVHCSFGVKPSGQEFGNCSADLNCAPNVAINCFAYQGEAYAGVTKVDGEDRGFVDCPGGTGLTLCPGSF